MRTTRRSSILIRTWREQRDNAVRFYAMGLNIELCLQNNTEARGAVECCRFGTLDQRTMARSLWRPHATRRSTHDLMQLSTQDGARAVSIVLCGAAFVMMVQTTYFANLNNIAFCGHLCSSRLPRIFAERQVSAPVMVIRRVQRKRAVQGAFAEDDHMVQTLATNGPDEPLHIGPLAGRSRRG